MNVLAASNEKYLEPLSVMLYSLAYHNRGDFLVYILHFDIPSKAQLEFQKKTAGWKMCSMEVFFISADKADFAGIGENPRYRQETNLRLLMQKLLPAHVDKILWLDADIIVKGNLWKFYEYPDKKQFAVVCDDMFPINEKRDILKRIGLSQNNRYFNAGVMLLYPNNIRRSFGEMFFLSFLRENFQKMTYPDQSVLNICLKDRLVWSTPEIYNLQLLRIEGFDQSRQKIRKAKILHYNTRRKPWECDYDGIATMQFWRYGVRVLGIRRCVQYFFNRIINIIMEEADD